MSFTDEDSSDSEWKETKMKTEKIIKKEHNSSHHKQKYSQKFCDKWLNIFHPWLSRCDDDPNKPFCRACQSRLDCNRCHLQRHERTTKHARNLEILVSKGEGAARQNLSIRQERSKYYQQRKKHNSSMTSSHDDDMGMDNTDDYIEEYVNNEMPAGQAEQDGETSFQFVQTEATAGDQYTEETLMKQEPNSGDSHGDPLPTTRSKLKPVGTGNGRGRPKKVVKKERMQLLMQIQKDKNDLMDSFKELMGGNTYQQQSPPREKNHVDLFFESVSSSVKALSPKLIAETKMRVSQLICELELRALTENDAANSSAGSAGAATGVVVATAEEGNTYVINQQPVSTVVTHGAHQQHHHATQHYETLS